MTSRGPREDSSNWTYGAGPPHFFASCLKFLVFFWYDWMWLKQSSWLVDFFGVDVCIHVYVVYDWLQVCKSC